MEVPISSYTSSTGAAPPGTTLRRPIAATSTINDAEEGEMMGYEEDITGGGSWNGAAEGITFTPADNNYNNGDTSSIWSADDSNQGAAGAAAGGGWMMGLAPTTWNKRTKILIGLIATTTLLCAIATGGGVAASRAKRANANKSWCVDTGGAILPVDAVIAAASKTASAKAVKETSTKSNKTKSPTVKSNKSGGGRAPTRRTLEERRRDRVLAATQFGQRVAVVDEEESGSSSGVLTNLWNGFISEAESYYYGSSGSGDKGSDATAATTTHHHVRRNLQSSKSKSPSYSKSKSPSYNKSTKSPTAKSGKSSGYRLEIEGVEDAKYKPCQCYEQGLAALGTGGAKSNKGSSSTSKSNKGYTAKLASTSGASAVGFGTSKSKSSGGAAGSVATTTDVTKPPINPTTAKSTSKSSTAKGASATGAIGSPSGGSKSNKAAAPGISEGFDLSECYSPNEIKPKSKSSGGPGPGIGSVVYSAKSEKQTNSLPDPVPDPILPATKPPTPRPSPRPTQPCKDCNEIIPEIVPGDKPTPIGPTDDVPRPPPSPPLTPSEVIVPPPPSPSSPDSPPAPTGGDPDPIIPGDKPEPISPTPPAPTPDRPTEPTTPTEPTPTSPSSPSSPSSPTPPAPTPEDRPLEPAETPTIATNCLNDPSWTSTDGDDCEAVESNPVSLCNSASSSGGVSASAACPAVCNTECLDNCDVNPNWSTGSGETCDDVAKDPIGLCGSVGTTSGSGAVTAIDACPTSCKDECLDNCDNDPFWITKDDETCNDVATDPKGLCDKLKSKDDDEKASTACPAACNLECYDNCDNSPFWENGNKQGCADVAEDPKAFCDTVDKDGVPANEACPASCNEECLLVPDEVEEIDFPPPAPTTPSPPVPSPITPSGGGGPMIVVPTVQPTGLPTGAFVFPTDIPTGGQGAEVTVGQGAESPPTLPPAGRLDGTTFPTDVVPTIPTAKPTSAGSDGVTITVSTETTGPPTLENREPDSA